MRLSSSKQFIYAYIPSSPSHRGRMRMPKLGHGADPQARMSNYISRHTNVRFHFSFPTVMAIKTETKPKKAPWRLSFGAFVPNLLLVSASALSLLMSGASYSVPITGLNNTGSGFIDGQEDSNYHFHVINGTTINITGYSYVGENTSPYWMPNDTDSKWLTPYNDANTSFDNGVPNDGVYLWTLQFDLAGYDPATASFTARMMSDNSSVVKLNGTQIASVGDGGYLSWATQFFINDHFLQGINILEFMVTNFANVPSANNPTGLRVEFLSSDVVQVPEPSTLGLLVLGLVGLGWARARQHGYNNSSPVLRVKLCWQVI